MRITGPYVTKFKNGTKRRMMTVVKDDGSKTSMTYARYLWIQHRGIIPPGWEVHHLDEDALNDVLENYCLVTKKQHARITQIGRTSPFKGIESGWAHGTFYAWMKKGCKCETCINHKTEFYSRRNEKRRKGEAKTTYGLPSTHGEIKHYRRGCRCDLCRKANADHARYLRHKKANS